MSARNLLFLIYQNRSGSTFLANQLSGNSNIAVAPEGHEGLQRLLAKHTGARSREKRVERLLEDIRTDPKLSSWQLDPEIVSHKMADLHDPFAMFVALCEAFADKHRPDARSVVVKGHFLHSLLMSPALHGLKDDRSIRGLYLLRDPRAMFASQKKSISSRSGNPMQDNALVAGLRWHQFARQAERAERSGNAMIVRYEDLILDNATTFASVLDFIGEDPAVEAEQSGALIDFIPENQKHLHTNIDSGPMRDRVFSWQKTLPVEERRVVELASGRAMKSRGYDEICAGVWSPKTFLHFARSILVASGRILCPKRLAEKRSLANGSLGK